MRNREIGVLGLAVAFVACESVPDVRYSAPDTDAATPMDDAGNSTDAALPDARSLPCGDAGPCDFATSTCCLTRLGFECVIRGTGCAGVDLQCHDGDDCAGNKICCAARGDGGAIKRLTCTPAPACANMNGAPGCDLDAGGPCQAGTSCTPSSVDGYGICQ
jgi:hypothetical protein